MVLGVEGSGFEVWGLRLGCWVLSFGFWGFWFRFCGFGRGLDLGLLLVVQERDARAEQLVEIESSVREEADAPAKQYRFICQQLNT